MHKKSDIQLMDYIEMVESRKTYHVYVYSMNDTIIQVKSNLDELGTSSVRRNTLNMTYNYSELVRELLAL